MTKTTRTIPGSLIFLSLFLTSFLFVASCEFTPSGKRYAYVYGISIYRNGYGEGFYPNLRYCDDDARSLETMLAAQGYEVTVRINSEASKTGILLDIAQAKADLNPNDTFLFYYSGHGYDSPVITIVPYGGVTQAGYLNYAGMITPLELKNAIGEINCMAKTVVLDSCFSGGFVDIPGGIDSIPQDYDDQKSQNPAFFVFPDSADIKLALSAAFLPVKSGNGIIVLSAAGSKEESWETEGHGLLTYFFLKTKENADFDSSGYVTVSEAWRYIGMNIQASWNAESSLDDFYPHISGSDTDTILF